MNRLAGVTASGAIAEDAYMGLTKFAGESDDVRLARYMDLMGISTNSGSTGPSGSKPAHTK